jgi:hypothetical protein
VLPPLARRITFETVPAGAALVCWALVVRAAPPELDTPLALMALTLALLYAGARGRALADQAPTEPLLPDVESVLRENLQAALAGGVWLLAAVAVQLLRVVWELAGLPGVLRDPADWLGTAFGATAFVAVVIYAVARWTAMERRRTAKPATSTSSD